MIRAADQRHVTRLVVLHISCVVVHRTSTVTTTETLFSPEHTEPNVTRQKAPGLLWNLSAGASRGRQQNQTVRLV